MSEKKKSKLGCTLGCLGLSLVGIGLGVLLFGGVGAAGVAFLAMGSGGDTPQSLSEVLGERHAEDEVVDADALSADQEPAPTQAEEGSEDQAASEDAEADPHADEDEAVADASSASGSASSSATDTTHARTTSSTSRSSSRSSSSRSSSSSSSSSSGTTALRPASSSTPEPSTSSGSPSEVDTDDPDYDFPPPEPERPSTKVEYPPLYEDHRANRASSWNVRTEGEITSVRLAVAEGGGTYPVPSLVPEDKYLIEADFGDGRYIEAGKINVKEGSRYFIQCKPSRKKCSVR